MEPRLFVVFLMIGKSIESESKQSNAGCIFDKGIGIFFGDNRFIKFGCEIFVNKLRVGRIRLLRILKSFNKN